MLDRARGEARAVARDTAWRVATHDTLGADDLAAETPADEAVASRQRLRQLVDAVADLPPQMQPPQRQADYTGLEQYLSENYTVERTELREGEVPDDVDVLIVGKPGPLDPRQQYALDQYLMRGGTIVALAGRYHIEPSRQGLSAVQDPAPFFDLLQTWGVGVRDALGNEAFGHVA